MRERFVPRLLEAEPESLIDEARSNLDPAKIWARMMINEKPGGHGERSVAVGTLDMAVWDAVAKIEGKPLYRLLAERYRGGKADDARLGLCRRRLLLSGQGHRGAAGRDARLSRPRLPDGQDEDRRRAAGRGPAPHRGGARGRRRRRESRASTPTAASISRRPSPMPRRWRPTSCAGTRRRAIRSTTRCRPSSRSTTSAPMATGENLFSMQDARNLIRYGGMRPDRDVLQFDCALSYGLVEYLRTLDMLAEQRLVDPPRRAAWRPPDVAQHRGGPAARRQRVLSGRVPARSAASPTASPSRTATSACPISPASASRPRPSSMRS